MFKNFLRLLTLLTVLISIDNVMGSAPGIDEWRDEARHPAPASVRQAADRLWTAVSEEGAAAFSAGWGIRKRPPCGFLRVLGAIFLCGTTECKIACTEFDTFAHDGVHYIDERNQVYGQRRREVDEALRIFKDTVNRSVSRPEQYSGDARICSLGSWVEDNRRRFSWPPMELSSASRDLRNVASSVRAFVNAHGGWASEADVKKGVLIAYPGYQLELE